MPFPDEPLAKRPEPAKKPGPLAVAGGYTITLLILFPIFLALLALTAVIFRFAWNTGLTGLVDAAGGNLSEIDYRTAFGGVVALMFVRSITGSDFRNRKQAAAGNGVTIINTKEPIQ